MPQGFSPLFELNKLPVAQAARLANALAVEETGLRGGQTASRSFLAHCAARTHRHKSGDNSESLSITASSKYKAALPDGKTSPTVGWCKCFGSSCNHNSSFSNYVASVGPNGAAQRFWTQEKVAAVKLALDNDEPIELGWNDWKIANGYSSTGVTCRFNERTGTLNAKVLKGNLEDYRATFSRLFPDRVPEDRLLRVCAARGYPKDVLRNLVADKVVGVSIDKAFPEDIRLSFAYYGLADCSGHPSRLIKSRLLNQKHGDRTTYTVTNPQADHLNICDMSAPMGLHEANTLAIVEGEPDAIAWRSMRPRDAVVCVGSGSMVDSIPDALARVSLKDRSIVYCVDRDIDGSTRQYAGDIEAHIRTAAALLEREPASFSVWICPQVDGKPSKDPNDFLLHQSGDPFEAGRIIRSPEQMCEVFAEAKIPLSRQSVSVARRWLNHASRSDKKKQRTELNEKAG